MPGDKSIRYITHSEIEKPKWDQCIDNASNGLIYAYSSYLDHMSHGWDALVLEDYEAVMPLTWKKKYGIYYLTQPYLTAQLGVFGSGVNGDTVNAFLNAIPRKFRYADIYLNHGNLFPAPGFGIYERANYVLDLNLTYFELQSGYRENIRRNIKRSKDAGCKQADNVHIEKVIALALHHIRSADAETKKNVVNFRKLFYALHKKDMARIYAIASAKNEIISSAVFFYSHNRAYYILVGNHPDGRTLGASHALIDAFIRDHAGQPLLLDFEGSDIRNLAFFYSSFGATEEKYAGVKWNRLPFFLKWFKK